MRMSRSLILVAGAFLLAACADVVPPTGLQSVQGSAAIQGGELTGESRYSSVGALLVNRGDPALDANDVVCTGSLISPTVFLTAAHCVVGWPAGTQFFVSFAASITAAATFIPATGFAYHPGYGASTANLNDVAVVMLPEGSTTGRTPYDLPAEGALDALAAQGGLNDAIFVNVGYGVRANNRGIPSFRYDGQRRVSLSEFMALQPTYLGLLMNRNATGLGGDCYGDSGGPKFLEGGTTVYAVVTTGDVPCRATSWDWRIDTPEARAFLGNYVTLP